MYAIELVPEALIAGYRSTQQFPELSDPRSRRSWIL